MASVASGRKIMQLVKPACVQHRPCYGSIAHPRSSLCDLAGYSSEKNVYRTFITWINRQSWRKVLPRPREKPGINEIGVINSVNSARSAISKGGGFTAGQAEAEGRADFSWKVACPAASRDAGASFNPSA